MNFYRDFKYGNKFLDNCMGFLIFDGNGINLFCKIVFNYYKLVVFFFGEGKRFYDVNS